MTDVKTVTFPLGVSFEYDAAIVGFLRVLTNNAPTLAEADIPDGVKINTRSVEVPLSLITNDWGTRYWDYAISKNVRPGRVRRALQGYSGYKKLSTIKDDEELENNLKRTNLDRDFGGLIGGLQGKSKMKAWIGLTDDPDANVIDTWHTVHNMATAKTKMKNVSLREYLNTYLKVADWLFDHSDFLRAVEQIDYLYTGSIATYLGKVDYLNPKNTNVPGARWGYDLAYGYNYSYVQAVPDDPGIAKPKPISHERTVMDWYANLDVNGVLMQSDGKYVPDDQLDDTAKEKKAKYFGKNVPVDCVYCGIPLKNGKAQMDAHMLGVVKQFGTPNQKDSLQWNGKVNTAMCPACKFMLSHMPFGMVGKYDWDTQSNKGLFINYTQSIADLYLMNQAVNYDLMDWINPEDTLTVGASVLSGVTKLLRHTASKRVSDIEIITNGEEDGGNAGTLPTYNFNMLSTKLAKVIYDNMNLFDKLGNASWKDTLGSTTKDYLSDMVFNNVLRGQAMDRDILELIRRLVTVKADNGMGVYYNGYHLELLVKLNYYLNKARGVQYMNVSDEEMMENIGKARRLGSRYARGLRNQNKITGLIMRLNAETRLLILGGKRDATALLSLLNQMFATFRDVSTGDQMMMPNYFTDNVINPKVFAMYMEAFISGMLNQGASNTSYDKSTTATEENK